jgi:hypothetical protein
MVRSESILMVLFMSFSKMKWTWINLFSRLRISLQKLIYVVSIRTELAASDGVFLVASDRQRIVKHWGDLQPVLAEGAMFSA